MTDNPHLNQCLRNSNSTRGYCCNKRKRWKNVSGTYKLGDFGISRILDKCQCATATTIVGTEAYLVPEQLKKGYDERVDIYSLGLLLYEMCRLPDKKRNAFTRKCLMSKQKATDSEHEAWSKEYPRARE